MVPNGPVSLIWAPKNYTWFLCSQPTSKCLSLWQGVWLVPFKIIFKILKIFRIKVCLFLNDRYVIAFIKYECVYYFKINTIWNIIMFKTQQRLLLWPSTKRATVISIVLPFVYHRFSHYADHLRISSFFSMRIL